MLGCYATAQAEHLRCIFTPAHGPIAYIFDKEDITHVSVGAGWWKKMRISNDQNSLGRALHFLQQAGGITSLHFAQAGETPAFVLFV